MTQQMTAIMKKDLRSITSNKWMFSTLLVVPITLSVILPTIFILVFHFAPQTGGDFEQLLKLLPAPLTDGDLSQNVIYLLLNYIMSLYFLIIPIMAAAVMSATSFVGEKEKQTLETLLYCPLSLKQIFRAKVLASFLLSMLVSGISFAAMVVVLETETMLITGSFVFPDAKWALILLLVSPAVSLIAITLIVRGSAKSQSVEDAQQRAVFLLLPVILLLVSQFTGVLFVSAWILLGLGLVCGLLAAWLLQKCMNGFQYETLLK